MTGDAQPPQMSFVCPSCGQQVTPAPRSVGHPVACSRCGTLVTTGPLSSQGTVLQADTMASQPDRSAALTGAAGAKRATGTLVKPALVIAAVVVPVQIAILCLGFLLLWNNGATDDGSDSPPMAKTDRPPEKGGETIVLPPRPEPPERPPTRRPPTPARIPESPPGPRPPRAPQPSPPGEPPGEPELAATTRHVLRIGGGEHDLAHEVHSAPNGRYYTLPLDGIAAEWRIRQIGGWDGAAVASGVAQRQIGNGIEFRRRSPYGGRDIRVACIKPQPGGLLLERAVGATLDQLTECLGNVAWLELYYSPRKETVIVLTKGLHRDVQLRRGANSRDAVGRVALPKRLADVFARNRDRPKCLGSVKNAAGQMVQAQAALEGTHLTVRVTCPRQDPRNARAAKRSLQTAEKKLDDEEAKLKRAKQFVQTATERLEKARQSVQTAQDDLSRVQEDLERTTAALQTAKGQWSVAPRVVEQTVRSRKKRKDLLERLKRAEKETQEVENTVEQAARALDRARNEQWRKIRSAEEYLSRAKSAAQILEERVEKAGKELQVAEARNPLSAAFVEPLTFTLEGQVLAAFTLKVTGREVTLPPFPSRERRRR